MGTFSRLLDAAMIRRIVPTDLFACLLGALAAAAWLLASRPASEAIGLVGLWAAATILAVVLLRLAMALSAARSAGPAMSEPERRLRATRKHDRAFLEQAYHAARAEFATDLRLYLEPMSQAYIMENFNNETIAGLNKRAAPFMGDREFSPLWPMFVSHFEHEAAVAYHDLDRQLDEDEAIQVSRNLNHCYEVRRAIVRALIRCLTYADGFDRTLPARLKQIEQDYAALGMIDIVAKRRAEPSQAETA